MRTVVISGVGLIGGSFGLALKASGFDGNIIGVGREETIRRALAAGAIDEGEPDLAKAAPRADLVYLSHSVTRILADIEKIAGILKPGAFVTDAGSTKQSVMAAASQHLRKGEFLGGHPMAGKAVRGVEHAASNLFQGAAYFICGQDDAKSESVEEFIGWIQKIGARPVEIGAEEHDALLAKISHLPQLISTALGSVLHSLLGPELVERTAGPGLRGMLRLAGSGYEDIWEDILKTNPAEIDLAVGEFLKTLEEMRRQLREPALAVHFEKAQIIAKSLQNQNN